MRDIKFRAWNPELKEMYYDFDQNIKHVGLGKSIHEFVYRVGLSNKTLMQYTDYEDINGVEIYENDFLESEYGKRFLVDFRNGSWMLIHEPENGSEREGEPKSDYLCDAVDILDLEIIGNIHENPQLL